VYQSKERTGKAWRRNIKVKKLSRGTDAVKKQQRGADVLWCDCIMLK